MVGVKQKGGSTWYKIKWKGYNTKYNVWRPEGELDCDEADELIAEFESGKGSGNTASGAIANLFAVLVATGAAGKMRVLL